MAEYDLEMADGSKFPDIARDFPKVDLGDAAENWGGTVGEVPAATHEDAGVIPASTPLIESHDNTENRLYPPSPPIIEAPSVPSNPTSPTNEWPDSIFWDPVEWGDDDPLEINNDAMATGEYTEFVADEPNPLHARRTPDDGIESTTANDWKKHLIETIDALDNNERFKKSLDLFQDCINKGRIQSDQLPEILEQLLFFTDEREELEILLADIDGLEDPFTDIVDTDGEDTVDHKKKKNDDDKDEADHEDNGDEEESTLNKRDLAAIKAAVLEALKEYSGPSGKIELDEGKKKNLMKSVFGKVLPKLKPETLKKVGSKTAKGILLAGAIFVVLSVMLATQATNQ